MIRVRLDGCFRKQSLRAMEKALMRLSGVKSVNLMGMKGHAIVEVTSDELTSGDLVSAVETVQGPGWHCTAKCISETGKLYSLEKRNERSDKKMRPAKAALGFKAGTVPQVVCLG